MYVAIEFLLPGTAGYSATTETEGAMPLKGENGYEMEPKLDEILRVFASYRCRCILYYLMESDDVTCSVDDLCEHVLAHDPETSDYESVATKLHHNDIPKLEETDMIDYDDRSKTVRFHGVRECESVLTAISDVEADR